MENSLFEIDVSQFYEKTRRDVDEYIKDSTVDNLLNALFSLNHLREWIFPDGHKSYEGICTDEMSPKQLIHRALYLDPDYQIICQLCNRAKHVKIKENSYKTTLAEGLIAGYARAGDNLRQKLFIVDDQDIRSVMERVLVIYKNYFGGDFG